MGTCLQLPRTPPCRIREQGGVSGSCWFDPDNEPAEYCAMQLSVAGTCSRLPNTLDRLLIMPTGEGSLVLSHASSLLPASTFLVCFLLGNHPQFRQTLSEWGLLLQITEMMASHKIGRPFQAAMKLFCNFSPLIKLVLMTYLDGKDIILKSHTVHRCMCVSHWPICGCFCNMVADNLQGKLKFTHRGSVFVLFTQNNSSLRLTQHYCYRSFPQWPTYYIQLGWILQRVKCSLHSCFQYIWWWVIVDFVTTVVW